MTSANEKLPRAVRVYIAVIILAAAAVAGMYVGNPSVGWPYDQIGGVELFLSFAFFTVAAFMAEVNPVQIPSTRVFDENNYEMTVSSAVYVACLLLFGPAFTLVVAAISILASQFWQREPLYKAAFNAGQYVITVGLGGVFLLATGTNPHSVDHLVTTPTGLAALVATVASYLVLNTGLVAMVLALVQHTRFVDQWRHDNLQTLPQYGGMLNIGVIAAILWTVSPVALVLLAVPMFVVHLAFKTTAQLKSETTRALVAIADMVDSRDSYAYRHSVDVARYSTQTATKLALPLDQVEMINLAALLHDIGKIGTPDRVLHKPGALDQEEWAVMQQHPAEGAKVLQYFSLFRSGSELVLHHQEHYDGSGYPSRIAGQQIPLGARIIHVADAYQAMTSDRVYRKALGPNVAVGRLLADAGKQFDPVVVKALIESLVEEGVPIDRALVESSIRLPTPAPELRDVPGLSGADRADPSRSHA